MSHHETSNAPERDVRRPGKIKGAIRKTGRAAIFPFRSTLISAPRSHIIDNSAVWKWDDWQRALKTLDTRIDPDELEALDEETQFWASVDNWPASVRGFVQTNAQCAALLFLLLGFVALLAVGRAGWDDSLTQFSRSGFLAGGIGALLVSLVLYISTCYDHARLASDPNLRFVSFLAHPERLWPFTSEASFRSLIRNLPDHLWLNWKLRYKKRRIVEFRQARLAMFTRCLIVCVLMAVAYFATILISQFIVT